MVGKKLSGIGVKFLHLTTTKHKSEEHFDKMYILSPRTITKKQLKNITKSQQRN